MSSVAQREEENRQFAEQCGCGEAYVADGHPICYECAAAIEDFCQRAALSHADTMMLAVEMGRDIQDHGCEATHEDHIRCTCACRAANREPTQTAGAREAASSTA